MDCWVLTVMVDKDKLAKYLNTLQNTLNDEISARVFVYNP